MDSFNRLVDEKEEMIDRMFEVNASKTPEQFVDLLLTYQK